jgi:ribose transport system permease protein
MNNASLSSDAAAAPTFLRRLGVRLTVRDLGTLIGLVVICAVFGLLSDVFFTERNLINILQQSSINSCVAIGMTMVIISGGVDLSVGPVAACSAVLAATVLVGGYSVFIAIPAGLLVGLLCGTFNGMLIAYGGLQPFIVTLGTLSLFRALALIYTGGNPILGVPSTFRRLFASEIGVFPVPVVVFAVLVVIGSVLLARTPLGEYIFAVGGNEEAARISGVPIARTKIAAYANSGFLAALAAIILIARLGAAEPTLGNLWEFEPIAASAIGGASLMGGKGSILGAIVWAPCATG